MKYIVTDWEGNSLICSNFRTAKRNKRIAERMTYTAWIKPYHGPLKAGRVLVDMIPQAYTYRMAEKIDIPE